MQRRFSTQPWGARRLVGRARGALSILVVLALAGPTVSLCAAQGGAPTPGQRARFAPREELPAFTDIVTFQWGHRGYGADAVDDTLGTVGFIGLEYNARNAVSGFGVEASLFCSSKMGRAQTGGLFYDVDLDLYESMWGGRYTQRLGSRLYAFCGGGVDLLFADGAIRRTSATRSAPNSLDAFSVGGYVHTGVYLVTPQHWVVGVDLRKTMGSEISILEDLDHMQLGFTIGSGF